jgi:hypothetical protein
VALLVGSLITLLAVRFQEKRKILAFDTKTFTLIEKFENQVEDLEISYRDKPIENLALSRVFIWNEGRSLIQNEDIDDEDPIRIVVDGEIVGGASSLDYIRRKQMEIQLVDQNQIFLDLKYLSHGEGMLFEFRHTWNEKINPEVKGHIKGFGEPRQRTPGVNSTSVIIFLFVYFPLILIPFISWALYEKHISYFLVYHRFHQSLASFWKGLFETLVTFSTVLVYYRFIFFYRNLRWVRKLHKKLNDNFVKVTDWPLIRWPSNYG